ncbi:hypothetical protein K3495_g2805 [Podosphaera aphanis]|nr:hypothetical protein K3495_g2805 [Podosphaera aphanis]
MASTVQRRQTYHYPSDNEEDTPAVVLDDQEQESLIQTLVHENATTNQTYTRVLLALPLLAIVPYIRTLLTPGTALLSLLSITSLLATMYLLVVLPPEHTGFAFLDRGAPRSHPSHHNVRRPSSLGSSSHGPLVHYLPYLNMVVCATQAVLGAAKHHRGAELWVGFSWLPSVIYGAVLLAKWMMSDVDPARDLNGLRYEFKGA